MTIHSKTIRALEQVARWAPSGDGVSVRFFSSWNREVSRAYRALGGEAWLPEKVLANLISNQRTHVKKVAVLHRRGRPWALVPLRLTGVEWQPLLSGVLDGRADFLCSGRRNSVLAALRLNLFVWHSPIEPSGWANLRWSTRNTSYVLSLEENPENYWRARDRWTTVLQARRRTAGFELVLNDLDSALWTIDRWHKRFYTGDDARVSAKWEDRKTVAEWGIGAGRIRSWALRDGTRWIAGVVATSDGERLTFSTVYRDPDYDWHGLGTRLFSEAFLWAFESGFKVVDLGADLDYKRWWAPPEGSQWHYSVSPLPVHALEGTLNRASAIIARLR